MSISHLQMQYAVRTQLLTMEAAATGSASLAATSDGFVRTTGSFITDGFEPGMELLAASFGSAANNTTWTVDSVTALTLFVTGLTVEVAGSGRTLTVGLPSIRAWENVKLSHTVSGSRVEGPKSGTPFVEEEFVSGPSSQLTVGTTNATIEVDPLYIVRVFVPEDTGVGAVNRYADAALAVFTSNSSITLTNGDALRVRTDTGPFRSGLTRQRAGWVAVPVNVPFRLHTLNS